MEAAVLAGQSLDGRDPTALGLGCQHQAGFDRLAIHDHGAGATIALAAAILGADQAPLLPQELQ